jgi:hypothetical protein
MVTTNNSTSVNAGIDVALFAPGLNRIFKGSKVHRFRVHRSPAIRSAAADETGCGAGELAPDARIAHLRFNKAKVSVSWRWQKFKPLSATIARTIPPRPSRSEPPQRPPCGFDHPSAATRPAQISSRHSRAAEQGSRNASVERAE